MDEFEAHRGLMFSIAYQMLGSVADAEDILQEAYLRYRQVPAASIASPKALLSTIVTRLCLNQLQSARARRESYIGPWLPEPIITEDEDAFSQIALEESISMAFLVLLERLTPVERAVFLLRKAFDYSYAEIAEIVGKEETACRQIFSRAKKFIAAQRPRFSPTREQHRLILQRFMHAADTGDLDGLTQLLSTDVALWADGGGKVRGAATRMVHGPNAVARFVLGSIRFLHGPYEAELTEVNREPAAILRVQGKPVVVVSYTLSRDKIAEIRIIGNPDKLRHIPTL